MEYLEFERVLSAKRLRRYTQSTGGDTRKAMALYRYNLKLSQEIFTIVSCFEVALRNAIDAILSATLGEHWLKDSVMPGGIFSTGQMNDSKRIIEKAYQRLVRNGNYSPSKYTPCSHGWASTRIPCSMDLTTCKQFALKSMHL